MKQTLEMINNEIVQHVQMKEAVLSRIALKTKALAERGSLDSGDVSFFSTSVNGAVEELSVLDSKLSLLNRIKTMMEWEMRV